MSHAKFAKFLVVVSSFLFILERPSAELCDAVASLKKTSRTSRTLREVNRSPFPTIPHKNHYCTEKTYYDIIICDKGKSLSHRDAGNFPALGEGNPRLCF